MKFALVALIATAAAATPDWTPCTKQDCSSPGWICCDVTKTDDNNDRVTTGTMLCTDPNTKGIVPDTVTDFAG